MKTRLPRAIRWRVIHYRARWLLLWHTRIRPSYLQREFNRGDPHGIVRAITDQINDELKKEDEVNEITISSTDIKVGPDDFGSYYYRIGPYLSKNAYANSQSALHDARRPQRLASNGRIEPAES